MSCKILFDQEHRDKAKANGKEMFAAGVRQTKGFGCCEMYHFTSWEMGEAMWHFCHLICLGKSPQEAFAAIAWPEPNTWPEPAEPKGEPTS